VPEGLKGGALAAARQQRPDLKPRWNGGRNYNGPKVAKISLSCKFPTCHEWRTDRTTVLGERLGEFCGSGEDAGCPAI